MDTKTNNVDQLVVNANLSFKKLDKNVAVMETDNIVDMSLSSSPLSPITPDSNKESSDIVSGLTSPLTLPTINRVYMNDDIDDSPGTPKDGVFDPFAPGPDNLMMAPVSMKYLQESRNYVARRLNFNSVLMTKKDCEERCFEDDLLLEAMYESLLEVIICKQSEDIVAEMSVVVSPDGVKTPPLATRLTGVEDTCPGAPLKAGKKSRKIDLGLCRKLEFDL